MADTLTRLDVVSAPSADEIFRPAPAEPDAAVRDTLALGIDMMQATTDELAVGVLERLCLRLADVADDLAVTRIMLSQSQTIAYERHVRIVRLEQRVSDLLDLARGNKATERDEDVRRRYTDAEWARVVEIARGVQ